MSGKTISIGCCFPPKFANYGTLQRSRYYSTITTITHAGSARSSHRHHHRPRPLADSPELSGGQQVVAPLLHVGQLDVEAGGDDATLVQTASQVHHDLAGTVVVDYLKLTDVACRGN